jgi:DNA-binding MarR family transcriptional regulator
MKDSNWFGNVSELEHSGGEKHLILEIMHVNKALLGAFSRGTGIPMSQLVLMRILAGAGNDGIGVLDISRIIGINGAAVTRQVKQMEERGLVLRRKDKYDRRKSYIKLSAKGLKLFMEVHQRVHELEDFLGASLEEEEIETTKRVLAHLRNILEDNQ